MSIWLLFQVTFEAPKPPDSDRLDKTVLFLTITFSARSLSVDASCAGIIDLCAVVVRRAESAHLVVRPEVAVGRLLAAPDALVLLGHLIQAQDHVVTLSGQATGGAVTKAFACSIKITYPIKRNLLL